MPDPASLKFIRQLETRDSLQALLKALGEKDGKLLQTMLEFADEGTYPTIFEISMRSGVSHATVERRLRRIRRLALVYL